MPYSVSLRIVTTFTNIQDSDKRLTELKEKLFLREYTVKVIDSAIDRGNLIPKRNAIKK